MRTLPIRRISITGARPRPRWRHSGNLTAPLRTVPLVLALGAAAWWSGTAIAFGGLISYAVLALAVGVLAWLAGSAVVGARREGFLSVESPVILLVLSTLVFRIRAADELAANPLDTAGLFRVACIGGALMLGLAALIAPPLPGTTEPRRLTSLPFRLYCFYVLFAVVGALSSVNVFLTFYRFVELIAALAVVAGAYRSVGAAATGRLESVIFWFIVGQLGAAWSGLVLFPSRAMVYKFETAGSPIPWQLEGVIPALGSNGVGELGMLLAIWSLGRFVVRRQRGQPCGSAGFWLSFGLASVVIAQYRTGYIAFPVAAAVLLILRWRALVIWGAVVVIAVLLASPRVIEALKPFALRGESTEKAGQLSSRLDWWKPAIRVWQQSPVFGRGLLTASRFEVLNNLKGTEKTATIHSTWVESLVGTGLVGCGLLLSSLLVALRRAFRTATRGGAILPLGFCTIILVNSVTGNTIEGFAIPCLLFLTTANSLPDPLPGAPRAPMPSAPAMPLRH